MLWFATNEFILIISHSSLFSRCGMHLSVCDVDIVYKLFFFLAHRFLDRRLHHRISFRKVPKVALWLCFMSMWLSRTLSDSFRFTFVCLKTGILRLLAEPDFIFVMLFNKHVRVCHPVHNAESNKLFHGKQSACWLLLNIGANWKADLELPTKLLPIYTCGMQLDYWEPWNHSCTI